MKRTSILVILVILECLGTKLFSQSKYQSNEGFISFFSSAPMEDIYAENKSVLSLIDLSTNEIAFVVNIADFSFKKSLMQTHFNAPK